MALSVFTMAAQAALLQHAMRFTTTSTGSHRLAVTMMSEVPPQWKGPAIKANATVDVTQAASEIKELLGAEEEALAEEVAAPEMTFELMQEQVPRTDDLEAMYSSAVSKFDLQAVNLFAEAVVFFTASWLFKEIALFKEVAQEKRLQVRFEAAKATKAATAFAEEKRLQVEELAAKARELELEDIKALVAAKAPEMKAAVRAKAEQIKETEAVKAAAEKAAAAYGKAAAALAESDAGQSLKESYAAARKSEAYQKAAAKGAELVQTVQAKVEEAELEAKARKELDAAVERARAARRAVEEYIAAQKEK